jgi:3-hydroxyacyl-CoA dehydrogenase
VTVATDPNALSQAGLVIEAVVLRDKVAAGDLGRKTSKGFYQW